MGGVVGGAGRVLLGLVGGEALTGASWTRGEVVA